MKIYHKLLTTCLLIFLAIGVSAQKDFVKAEEAFNNFEYFKAIEFYKVAFLKTNDRPRQAEITFKVAECYRFLSLPKDAEQWYKKAIQVKYPDPLSVLYFADMLKMNGNFEEANVQYEKYMKLVIIQKIGLKNS